MTELPELRQALLSAAERATLSPRTAVNPGRARTGRVGQAVLAAAVVGVSVAILAVAIISIHHSSKANRTTANPAALTGTERHLESILAVLRRPQTAADRQVFKELGSNSPGLITAGLHVDPASARLATITPWGTRVMLVLAAPAAKQRAQNPVVAGLSLANRSGLIVEVGRSSSCCATASALEESGNVSTSGWGRSFAGGSVGFRLYDVVPDGVAKVTFVLPRDANAGEHGAPVYQHVLRVTVPVHGNVAAIEEAHRQCCGSTISQIWYSASGKVIHTVGDPAGAGRVQTTPQPGPVTAQSQAAQHDPATPNRVWVTPAVGGPHTQFKIHFRVLLNGADYAYKFTGTSCPSFTFPGGTGKPNALRGSLWSNGVGAVRGQALCPGTYHVSVSVMDLGSSSTRIIHAKPFGSATFTVKR